MIDVSYSKTTVYYLSAKHYSVQAARLVDGRLDWRARKLPENLTSTQTYANPQQRSRTSYWQSM